MDPGTRTGWWVTCQAEALSPGRDRERKRQDSEASPTSVGDLQYLDGSPVYLASHPGSQMETQGRQWAETLDLCFLVQVFTHIYTHTSSVTLGKLLHLSELLSSLKLTSHGLLCILTELTNTIWVRTEHGTQH